MKRFTLLAAGVAAALAANAQYNVDPSTSVVVNAGAKTVDYITLSEAGVAEFEKAGAKVTYVGPAAELGRNLWYWEQTFIAGDESYPRVDEAEGGYISVVVSNVGWSGAGEAVTYNPENAEAEPGLNFTHLTDETRFHLAYMTPSGNGPVSVALILMDGGEIGSMPAKVALGEAFNDNGAVYPAVGEALADDWKGIDISFADLKKVYPDFKPAYVDHWNGNLFSFLGGGVEGQTIAFDAVYFYNPGKNDTPSDGIEGVAADTDVDFIVTANTINVNGANGISLYGLDGRLVKSAAGSVLGISSLPQGVYVAKAGNVAKKVAIR